MSLKEKLASALLRPARLGSELSIRINEAEAKKVLALLTAAKKYLNRGVGVEEEDMVDALYAARDDLLNAIHQMEAP